MEFDLYHIDAFAERVFGGNPAAVVPLEAWLPDETLLACARENNLSETAYFVPDSSGQADFELRWFTPGAEVDLCGHATLATGHVLYEHRGFQAERIRFRTRSGIVAVGRRQERLVLDFPSHPPHAVEAPPGLQRALGDEPLEVLRGHYLMVTLADEAALLALRPDFRRLAEIDEMAVMVTAPGEAEIDFVSRFFAPRVGIDEDPVTGSAHTTLAPYWGQRLGKQVLEARQRSARGGALRCTLRGERVDIEGRAVTYLVGRARLTGR